MIYIPVIGALALGVAETMQKFILRSKKISVEVFQVALFFVILLVMLPFLWFFWKLDFSIFSFWNIFVFVLIVLFSLLANIFSLYAIKGEKLGKLEPAKVLEPLFVILLAILFSFIFGTAIFERNNKIIIPALIAGLALVFSHIKKDHIHFNKYFLAAIAGSFFYALELVLSKFILNLFTPISFYFIRCLFIFILALLIFRPSFKNLDSKLRWKILIVGFVWVIYRVAVYYGYSSLGIISTTLIVMLAPIFIYIFAYFFLKEKASWRNIIASLVIVGCVVYAIIG